MMYDITIDENALEFLEGLPKKIQRQVGKKIMALAKDPRPQGCRKLQGEESVYRIKSGDYRIIYAVNDKQITVYVVRIGDRKNIYQIFKRR
jgi:mRNA interferase RelE/StbE